MPIGIRGSELPPASGSADGAAFSGPPDVLLHSGGPTPSTAAEEALALDALRLLRLIEGIAGRPARWTAAGFRREVDLVRAHLRPIRTRAALAASFGREAFHGQAPPGSDRALGASAVRVAYAIRWLEIEDGVDRPGWRDWVDSRVRRR